MLKPGRFSHVPPKSRGSIQQIHLSKNGWMHLSECMLQKARLARNCCLKHKEVSKKIRRGHNEISCKRCQNVIFYPFDIAMNAEPTNWVVIL